MLIFIHLVALKKVLPKNGKFHAGLWIRIRIHFIFPPRSGFSRGKFEGKNRKNARKMMWTNSIVYNF